jgi:hypothetical protein
VGLNFPPHTTEPEPVSASQSRGLSRVIASLFAAFAFGIFLPENMGAVSDEHGEMFRQDVSQREKRYSGKWSSDMLADCCWSIVVGHQLANVRRKRMKCLCSSDTVRGDIGHCVTLYVVSDNQCDTFLLQNCFVNLTPSP